MADLREELSERLRRDLGSEAGRVRILSVDTTGAGVRIRAELAIEANLATAIEATGFTPGTAYAAFVGVLLERIEELRDLLARAEEPCWVCGSKRERSRMEPELIGTDMWWLCDRCRRRRDNAAERGLVWPAEFDAWWRHWMALRLAEGRSEHWILSVRRRADELHDTDPFTPNRMAAVMKVAEQAV